MTFDMPALGRLNEVLAERDQLREALAELLELAEEQWESLEAEFSTTMTGLDEEIRRGNEPTIAKAREVLKQYKENDDV